MSEPGFVIGNIAKGKDLWDRKEEIESIWKSLEKNSVLLKAPRRFGKTSVMYNLFENPSSDFKTIFIDTEGLKDPQDFVTRLTSEMLSEKVFREKITDWLKKKIPSISELGLGINREGSAEFRIKLKENIGEDWREKGFELISKARDYEGQLLCILDELPLLVQNIWRKDGEETARDFLFWFRSVRQELSNVRWLVGGSIGIEHILNSIDAGTKAINDFQPLSIGPFSEIEGRNYIKALLKNEGQIKRVQEKIIDGIMEKIGAPVPYFIQILIYESLNEMRRQNKKNLDKTMIEEAYIEGVLGPSNRTYFEHYYTRLKDYYDEDLEHVAKALLLEVARKGHAKKTELFKLFRTAGEGRLKDEKFSYVMADMENDFYVSYNHDDNSYSFTTNLLRDWWLRYYDMVEE